ncbi:MAG: FAD-binding oxidoreductase [Acidobacteria bacterium]|nr:FAD-binding oxidoreductase [Acidobacteriota bacterium]
MQVKTQADQLQNYLTDASNVAGGHAEKLLIPETTEELAEILREANASIIPLTVSGARTGTVGGAIPYGGYLISLEKFDKIKEINREKLVATVECGVILNDFQKAIERENVFYPPDPTEWSCQIGGTIATNASGARSFKYGATRNYVERLEIVLPTGEIINLRRGQIFADKKGKLAVPVSDCGEVLIVPVPTYAAPKTRKNASGYFSSDALDAVDLFVGSEGTLGVITEIELKLLPKPEGFLSGIVFFEDEKDLLAFVDDARKISFESRNSEIENRKSKTQNRIDATLLEYFDENSLRFIKEKFPETPENMAGAIFFEQQTNAETEDALFEQWNALLEKHRADLETSWFTTGEIDAQKMRAFRHALPVAVNERIVKYKQRKVGTDMAVPDENFVSFLKFYKQKLKMSALDFVIFGHIGDAHLHANILPKNSDQMTKAKHLYGRFVAQSVMLGGTVSAEHGIGKLKKKYLKVMYGERFLSEMAELKRAFDPNGILNRNNIFDEKYL